MRSLYSKLSSWYQRSRIKYIVWDFDGTLYQSPELGQSLKEAFYQISTRHCPDLNLEKFDLLSQQNGSWSKAASVLISSSEFDLLDEVDRLIEKARYIKPNPPVVDFIGSTNSQYNHLILTNSTYQEVVQCLPLIGFDTTSNPLGPFKAVFSRDLTKKLKPDPDLFVQILAFSNISKGRHLFVGDSLSHDIEPAQAKGFNAIPIWELTKLFPKLNLNVS